MKKLFMFVVCVSIMSTSHISLYAELKRHNVDSGIIYDSGEFEQDEAPEGVSARSVYTKAGLWTVVAGLMVYGYPARSFSGMLAGFKKDYYKSPEESLFDNIRYVIEEDNRYQYMPIFLLSVCGTYFIVSKTFRSWYEAYCTYIRQHPRHGSSGDHGICRDEQNETEV